MSGRPQQRQRQRQNGNPQGQNQHGKGSRQASSPHILEDESVLVDVHPAWTVWIWELLGAALLILVGLLLVAGDEIPELGMIVAVIGLFVVGLIFLRRKQIRYVITDRRVMISSGLLATKTTELWVDDIRSMQTGASFLEGLLGHGTIIVSDSTLSRSAINVLSFLPIISVLPLFNAGRGLTLAGINDPVSVANIIRTRQSERK